MTDSAFTGKYDNAGRIGGLLLDRFFGDVRGSLMRWLVPGVRILEVGAGAGFSTDRLRSWLPAEASLTASDISPSLLAAAAARCPDVSFVRQSAYALAVPDRSFDVVVMLEVLEHLEHPVAALRELRRVARQGVVISTPREPLWRVLNCARGKYLASLGNTPGHIQHWSSRGLARVVGQEFEVLEVRRPLPWTVVAARPPV